MSIHVESAPGADRATSRRVAGRLRPLFLATALQGLMLWVPVEKLFLSDIGFTPTDVGLMAAVYAGVVPLAEVPSGVLADRWSRRGVLGLAGLALALCSLIGGLSTGVPGYLVSAVCLGVFFAMYSGTTDSMVYDTLVEEIGDGGDFTRYMGWVRAVGAASFAVSALAGGLLAEAVDPRFTYLATVPIALLSLAALRAFREPQLHRSEEGETLRQQLRLTVRTISDRGVVLPVVLLGAVSGVGLQLVFEFGPLWLVAIAAPTVLFGPHWAALTATLGVGGLLAGRVAWDRTAVSPALGLLMTSAAVVTVFSRHVAVITAAQTLLALVLVVVGALASQRLHDAIPSHIRASVASGAGTMAWLSFLPAALLFGWLVDAHGLAAAGWLLTGLAALTALMVHRQRGGTPPAELTCRDVVDLSTAHLDGELDDETEQAVLRHQRLCPGCTAYFQQVRDLLRAVTMLR